ncbi:hypothetical protein ABW20_dc0102745 [Dactylellina cionopaga]|nr:hypothetical protein ABW20_dc0102745 [Dactylellina cionopaga]
MKLHIIYAILTFVPSIAGHAAIIEAWGEAGDNKGCALGILPGTPRGSTKGPGQADTGVFSNPTIPDKWCKKGEKIQTYKKYCKKCKCKVYCKKFAKKNKVKRDPEPTKANKQAKKAAKTEKKAAKKAAKSEKKITKQAKKLGKNIDKDLFIKCRREMCPNGWGAATGSINVDAWTSKMAQSKTIPQVYPGGILYMKVHQINPDGGGPYICQIDFAGKGDKWESQPLQMLANVDGQGGLNPFKLRQWTIMAQLPKDLTCSGSYGGADNICMVRCNNEAANGPFGGCIPIQLVDGDHPDPPAPVPTNPVFVNTTAPVTDIDYDAEFDDDSDMTDDDTEDKPEPPELEVPDEPIPAAEPDNQEEGLDDNSIDLLENAGYYNRRRRRA